ncbi:DUF3060 domain-containing protein [Pseudomonas oryzihabitans]|uniref:DUF3060 domain-containing protein n=1 Tax=Pseudomonas oryzihabitans TaxID=47885 RepID=UPI002894D1F2|nr:DUF3060 domain-containing protein [Pseudomonas oryzihabitans]MDT3718146.1 DUF3060 domain-containing protein [Pseudomonas oryzihabitans]
MSSFKALLGCCLLVAPLLVHAEERTAEPIEIEGLNLTRTLDCQGRDVSLSGEGNTLTLKGLCGEVAVYGSHHRLMVDSAQTLAIHGLGSVTTVKGSVANLSIGGGYQQVQANVRAGSEGLAKVDAYGYGAKARLTLLSPADIAVGGSNQQVYWSRAAGVAEPKTLVSGADNVLQANQSMAAITSGDPSGLNANR